MAKLQFYSRLKVSSKLTSTPSPAGKGSVGTELSGKCPYDFPVAIWKNLRLKMGLRSYLQASATVTKPIVIYLGQTLKPKPQRKIFEEKEPRPKVSQGRHSFFLPTFGFSFFYYLT